jgi:hypothetical protein
MKKRWIAVSVAVLSASFAHGAFSGEKAPPRVVAMIKTDLVKWGTDRVIVAAVRAENARRKTLDQIRAADEKWKTTPGIDAVMKSLMESECGRHLKALQSTRKAVVDLFAMDNQGAVVAMTNKTSDYWQGDEDKFTKSYNGGTGGLHVSDILFDEGIQSYVVQASFPVKDNGRVIGAVTVGISVEQ